MLGGGTVWAEALLAFGAKQGPATPKAPACPLQTRGGSLGIMCNEQRGAWGPITFVRAWKGLIRAPSGAVGQKAREGDGKKHAAGDRGEGSVWRSPERRWPRGGGHSDIEFTQSAELNGF